MTTVSQKSNSIAAATLAAVVLACSSSPKDEHNNIEARIICEDFVKDRLKSPGTADFTDQSETGQYPTFTASGAVDSQNTFGGIVRNNYTCTVTYHPSTDKWTLGDLSGLEN